MEILKLKYNDVKNMLPQRPVEGHKGTFGKLLLLCGSRGYTGAAALSALGALRSGAGLVYLCVPESIYAIEAIKLTEPVVLPMNDDGGMLSGETVPVILELLEQMDAVLIGPGLGQSAGTLAVLQAVMEHAQCPVVVDADGINLLATHMDILRKRQYTTILTPHAGEFARLGVSAPYDRVTAATEFARQNGCILCLKGHGTVVTDGVGCYINETGNNGMAVGGSGDVLSGVIVSLCGQGMQPLQAAACGVWLHGMAGDVCKERLGQYGMLPMDMLEVLPQLMK